MKKKYKVIAQMITNLEVLVEAESAEEAQAIGKDLDGAVFTEIEGSGDWSIYDAFEVVSDEEAVNCEGEI